MQPPCHTSTLTADLRASFLRLIEERLGLRLSVQQAAGLAETVLLLLKRSDCDSLSQLHDTLASGLRGDLLDHLAAAVTIGETYFFRVMPQIQALQHTVLPDLIARRSDTRRLRIWSSGCSTGEEPYTLAILLHEGLPLRDQWDVQILATDINCPALDCARQGLYGDWSFRETPDSVRQRYFAAEQARWRLIEPIRRMVQFSRLNMVEDAFPSVDTGGSFDVILCRNVTIYFGPETAQRLYQRFAGALAPGGWLVLGPSDPAPEQSDSLVPVYLPGAVLWHRPLVAPEQPSAMRLELAQAWRGIAARPAISPPQPAMRLPARRRAAPVRLRAPEPAQSLMRDSTGDRTAARLHAEQLVRTKPLDVHGHLLLGLLCLDQHAVEAAIESLRRAAFLDETLILAHFSLGQAYVLCGDQERARTAFSYARRLLAAAPDDHLVPGGGELSVNELRYALDANLAGLV